MLSFIDLIDITDSAAQDLEATISLLGIIKDRVYQFAEINENNDALICSHTDKVSIICSWLLMDLNFHLSA